MVIIFANSAFIVVLNDVGRKDWFISEWMVKEDGQERSVRKQNVVYFLMTFFCGMNAVIFQQ